MPCDLFSSNILVDYSGSEVIVSLVITVVRIMMNYKTESYDANSVAMIDNKHCYASKRENCRWNSNNRKERN
jgi:hypothetical protein